MATLDAVFNHMVLPPKLPGRQDSNLEDLSQDFLGRLLRSCKKLETFVPQRLRIAVSSLHDDLQLCRELNHGRLEKASLISALGKIEEQSLILHVVEQNAALLIRFDHRYVLFLISKDSWAFEVGQQLISNSSDVVPSVVFEAFEASPPSEDVLASKKALVWTFPGRASRVPLDTFKQHNFQESLAEFLEKFSMDALSRFNSVTRKANVDVAEIRDTTDPALIAQMLMPLLDSLGSPIEVPLLRKRVRDDVSIDGSLLPWRRHPFWLILRVTAQRLLRLEVGDLEGRVLYKMLITICLVQLMAEGSSKLRPEMTLLLRSKICRRLAKLEMERAQQQQHDNHYSNVLNPASAWLKDEIDHITRQISLAWDNFKLKTMRSVSRLPPCTPASDLRMSLPASGAYLYNLLQPRSAARLEQGRSRTLLDVKDQGIKQVMRFTKRYLDLADIEKDIRR